MDISSHTVLIWRYGDILALSVKSTPPSLQGVLVSPVNFVINLIFICRICEFFTLLQAHENQCFRKASAGFQPPPSAQLPAAMETVA